MNAPSCPLHPSRVLEAHVSGVRDQFFGYEGVFDYKRCAVCGVLVLDPRPSPSEIGHYYGRYYPEALITRLRERAARGRITKGAGRLRALGTVRRLQKLGVELFPEMHMLDVGAGLGSYARSMRALTGMAVRTVDFSSECTGFVSEVMGLPADQGELAAQNYPDGSYDLVTAWHYMEHVYDPEAHLREMARVLKPGGWLVIETPCPGLLSRLFGRKWFYLMPPTHLYHYPAPALAELVERSGLQVRHLARPWYPGELAGSMMLTLGVRAFFPDVISVGRKPWLTAAFLAQMVYDLPLSLALALTKRSGLVRIFAQKPS